MIRKLRIFRIIIGMVCRRVEILLRMVMRVNAFFFFFVVCNCFTVIPFFFLFFGVVFFAPCLRRECNESELIMGRVV